MTGVQTCALPISQVDGNLSLMLRSPKDFVGPDGQPIVPPIATTSGLVLKTMITDWDVLPPSLIVVAAPR